MEPGPVFLTPSEARRILRVSKPKIYELLDQGLIPGAFRLGDAKGSLWRIAASELWRLGRGGEPSVDPAAFWPVAPRDREEVAG